MKRIVPKLTPKESSFIMDRMSLSDCLADCFTDVAPDEEPARWTYDEVFNEARRLDVYMRGNKGQLPAELTDLGWEIVIDCMEGSTVLAVYDIDDPARRGPVKVAESLEKKFDTYIPRV